MLDRRQSRAQSPIMASVPADTDNAPGQSSGNPSGSSSGSAPALAPDYCDAHGEPDPARAPQILEHGAAQNALREAQAKGRLHHAWLIGGARGIGKATLAWAWARFLLHYGDQAAGGAPGLAVPPDSRAAALLRAQSHPDFLHVHADWDARARAYRASLSVAALRRIPSLFALSAAARSGWRVCLIDSADAMTPTAANALLKILEEPPPRALFVIVCHHPGRLLPTIRSRCQSLRLARLQTESVMQILAWHFPAMARAERLALAQLGQGSAGQALTFARSQGQDFYAQTLQILRALPQLPYEAMHRLADELARSGASHSAPRFARFAELLLGILHRCARALEGDRDAPLPQERALAAQWARAMPSGRLAEAWQRIAALAERNAQLQLDGRQSLVAYFALLAQGLTGRNG